MCIKAEREGRGYKMDPLEIVQKTCLQICKLTHNFLQHYGPFYKNSPS
jgi:hypothetical protein